jgi:CheY-like chemotaxis protein
MRLEYHILWVEDNTTWLPDAKEQIQSYLIEKAYSPQIEVISSNFDNDQTLSKLVSNKYDLILMDFTLTA